jgi:hypothetical protein
MAAWDSEVGMKATPTALICLPIRPMARLSKLFVICAPVILPIVTGHFLLGLVLRRIAPGFGWHGIIGAGFVGLVFVGACVVVVLRPRGPQLVVNDLGIESRNWPLGIIGWNDIRHVSIVTMYENEVLGIDLRNPDKYLSNASRAVRRASRSLVKKGLPPIVIGCDWLDHSPHNVLAFIRERHEDLAPPDIDG